MAPAAAPDQKPQDQQPLQDANGRHDTPPLLPAPSLRAPPTQTQAQASHLTLRSNAGTPISNEPVSITVGSIANAYFASAPGAERMSAWGCSQLGPGQEGSQAAALGGQPGFTGFPSPAAASPSTHHADSFPSRSPAVIPFASNYMNGIPWEADSAASLLYPSAQRQQQQQPESAKIPNGTVGTQLDHGRKPKHTLENQVGAQQHALAASDKLTQSSGGSNASRSANSRRSRGWNNNQQAAEAVGRRPKAAANSPARAVQDTEAGSSKKVRPAARSPPRYHQSRYALTPLLVACSSLPQHHRASVLLNVNAKPPATCLSFNACTFSNHKDLLPSY